MTDDTAPAPSELAKTAARSVAALKLAGACRRRAAVELAAGYGADWRTLHRRAELLEQAAVDADNADRVALLEIEAAVAVAADSDDETTRAVAATAARHMGA